MDPLAVSAVAGVLDKFLGAAATEAGRGAWAGLVGLVRSAFPERSTVTVTAAELAPRGNGTVAVPNQGAVIGLSAELAALAQRDAGFASALGEWLEQARTLSVEGGITTNVISDGATVRGNVVQARDVGNISFG